MCMVFVIGSCLVFLFASSVARSTEPPATETTTVRPVEDPVTIVTEQNLVFADGNFRYSYISGDGSKAEQTGSLKTFEEDKAGEAVKGSFEYIAPNGEKVSITYTADENGYRPSGSILPTSPPIPEAIARGLKFIEEHPWVEEKPEKKPAKNPRIEPEKKSVKTDKNRKST